MPQVVTAIAVSLLGAELARRIGTKRVYLIGLACSAVSMGLLPARDGRGRLASRERRREQ